MNADEVLDVIEKIRRLPRLPEYTCRAHSPIEAERFIGMLKHRLQPHDLGRNSFGDVPIVINSAIPPGHVALVCHEPFRITLMRLTDP